MPGFTVKIEGLKELGDNLDKMKAEKATRAIRKALRKGAEVFKAEVELRAPERVDDGYGGDALPVGALQQDIQIHQVTDNGNAAIYVSPGKYTARVADEVEYGHRLVKGGRSRVDSKTGKTSGPGTEIGQVPAHPFIRPAYEAVQTQATDAVINTLREEIEKSQEGN